MIPSSIPTFRPGIHGTIQAVRGPDSAEYRDSQPPNAGAHTLRAWPSAASWASATRAPRASNSPGSHAACICSKSCCSSRWMCALSRWPNAGRRSSEAGCGIGFQAANHRPHGVVVGDQGLHLAGAVRHAPAGGRKDVRLLDIEVRAQIGLEKLDQLRGLLSPVRGPVGARIGRPAQDQPLRHDEAEVVVARQRDEALVALHLYLPGSRLAV